MLHESRPNMDVGPFRLSFNMEIEGEIDVHNILDRLEHDVLPVYLEGLKEPVGPKPPRDPERQ